MAKSEIPDINLNAIPPWMVAFVRYGPGGIIQTVECAGTLVGGSWVLTAAHAVLDCKTTTAVVGKNPLTAAPSDAMFSIKQIVRHPSYTPLLTPPPFDLALVELNMPPCGPCSCVTLAGPNEFLPRGEVFGWGQTVGQAGRFTNMMKQIAVTIEYPVVLEKFGALTYQAVSASLLNTCYGDSGGPLLISKTGNTWCQIGITSSLSVARECRNRSIYTGVAANMGFIRQVVGDSLGLTAPEPPCATLPPGT